MELINKIRKYIDPKYLQVSILFSYAIVAREFYSFEKEHTLTLAIVAFSIFMDQAISYYLDRKFRFNLTPFIIGLACSLLINSEFLYVYLIAVIVSNLSKLVFRLDKKHIYNPAAFGVAFSLLFLGDSVTGNLNLFNGDLKVSALFFTLGAINVLYARMYKMSFYWLLFYLIINLGNMFLTNNVWQLPVLIMLNPGFIIFTFHMISDPRTLPSKKIWLVGLVYAGLDFIFRYNKIPNGFFYAVILGQSIFALFESKTLNKYKWLPITVITLFSMKLISMKIEHPHIVQHKYPPHLKKVLFERANEKVGVTFKHSDEESVWKDETMAKTYLFNAGIAVGDINNDGWEDFIAINSDDTKDNHLYINNKGKGFFEEANKWGVARYLGDPVDENLYYSVSPTLFDADNDGDLDLYISRVGCDLYYENTGNKFELKNDRVFCENSKYAFPFDYDKDGDFDLLLIRYLQQGYKLTKEEIIVPQPNNSYDASNGSRNYIILNTPEGWKVHEDKYFSEDTRFSFDATIFDPYNDGRYVLSVVNDFGTNVYYDMNNNYKIITNLFEKDRRNSMSVHSHYQTNEDKPELYISNIYLQYFHTRGNFVYKVKSNDYTYNVAHESNLYKCGWAWGGVYADYNLDGYNDIYVTNGLYSNPKFKTLNSNNQAYSFVLYKNFSRSQFELLGVDTKKMDPVMRSFWLVQATASFQKDCLFIYDYKEKKYINVAEESGISKDWDGRAVAKIDYDKDGDLDLIVSAQNQELNFLENKSNDNNEKKWIGFELLSNNFTDKLGTKMIIWQDKDRYQQEFYYGKSGLMSRSDPRLHFGLKSDKELTIQIQIPGREMIELKRKFKLKTYHKLDLDNL